VRSAKEMDKYNPFHFISFIELRQKDKTTADTAETGVLVTN